MARTLSIFGVTGSVGGNTADLVARRARTDGLTVVAVTGNGNVAGLAEQARRLHARIAVTADPAREGALKAALAGSGIEVGAGPEALIAAAAERTDWTMSAIVGAAGLAPTLAAAARGGVLALANKESLVCAGRLLRETCAAGGTTLVPVDSEHSAIFQCLIGEDDDAVERIILTASGGPFRGWSVAKMADVTPREAAAHPNWDMGLRISIDSASLFNKAMEMIETRELFGVRPDQVEVIIHPQSIIHSMVGFVDGSIIAQMGPSDMKGAIGYALNWPRRRDLPVARLDFARLARLDFEPVDEVAFPAIRIARKVMDLGGLSGAVFNAAKEAALDAFIAREVRFLDMAVMVEHVLDALATRATETDRGRDLAAVLAIDAEARQLSRDWVDTFLGR